MAELAEQLMFDALAGAQGPTPLLGDGFVAGPMVEARFLAVVAQARAAVESFFSVALGDGAERARALDELVDSLRQSGWEPGADAALYTLQLGALLMDAVLRTCGGEAVFRSERDLTHASVFFRATGVELFPFHKAFKAVTRKRRESLAELYELARQLAEAERAGMPQA